MQNRLAEQFPPPSRQAADSSIDEARSRLLAGAQQVLRQSSDFIARHPAPCLAAAIGVGVLLGVLLKRR
jgi:ElaB/YqjD/DUF883 family membrane-anchored ribosome-binding protein